MIRKDIIFFTLLAINCIIGGYLYVTDAPDGIVIVTQMSTLVLPMVILIVAMTVSNKFNDWIHS